MMEGMQIEYHYMIHQKFIIRLKEENPEEEEKTHETTLSSGHCPSIQKLIKEDNMNKIDSKVESGGNGNNDDENLQNINPETTDNEDDESLQNLKPEIRNEEENAQNSRIGEFFFQKQTMTEDIYCSSS